MARRINPKLSTRYYGPFQVKDRVGDVAYKLLLPPTTRIHPIFHISQLKTAIGDHPLEPALPPKLQVDNSEFSKPEAFLSSRDKSINGQQTIEWLIRWKNRPVEYATWEKIADITVPKFCLENKARFSGDSIDRDLNSQSGQNILEAEGKSKILKIYTRKKKINCNQ